MNTEVKRVWHIVPVVQRVARARISRLTAECFIIRLSSWSILHSTLQTETATCSHLKGFLLVVWQMIYLKCQFTYILFMFVYIHQTYTLHMCKAIQHLIFLDRFGWTTIPVRTQRNLHVAANINGYILVSVWWKKMYKRMKLKRRVFLLFSIEIWRLYSR